jgi:hypothetical protein
MSSVYYSLLSTQGPPLITAQLHLAAPWSTPSSLVALLLVLQTLDFAEYTSRRVTIRRIRSAVIPAFAYTYPFDPADNPIVPPRTQVRFPASGAFAFLPPTYLPIFQQLEAALAYRDSDGPIAVPAASYTAALGAFAAALNSSTDFYDRLSWELLHVLIWAPYPPPPLSQCPTPPSSLIFPEH